MGLFLIGLALVGIGAMLLFAPGSLTRFTALAELIAGAAFLELSRADRFASAALIILAIGFGYFWHFKQTQPTEEEAADLAVDNGDEE